MTNDDQADLVRTLRAALDLALLTVAGFEAAEAREVFARLQVEDDLRRSHADNDRLNRYATELLAYRDGRRKTEPKKPAPVGSEEWLNEPGAAPSGDFFA